MRLRLEMWINGECRSSSESEVAANATKVVIKTEFDPRRGKVSVDTATYVPVEPKTAEAKPTDEQEPQKP